MVDFGKILKKGKKIFELKDNGGDWGRCEECNQRRKLFPFKDAEDQVWMLCESCIELFLGEDF